MKSILGRLSDIKSSILLIGETGTGKSRLAEQIHYELWRDAKPFVAVNMASICESLFESELFGHQRGAFTGALQDRIGLCEQAGGGTLFLDEIGELSLVMQKKLLRLLEERKFRSVGSTKEKQLKARVIAATNRNLEDMVHRGEFREDLFFRLRVFSHRLAPLRECRRELQSLLERFCNDMEVESSKELLEDVLNYHWPGNVRELKNAIEYFGVMGSLPEWVRKSRKFYPTTPSIYSIAKEEFEREFLREAIQKNAGGINRTARNIKISKSTLIAKLRKYDIQYRC